MDEYLIKIDGTKLINSQIDDINHDFTVLAKRIQAQSKTISLFDTIHIESVYSPTDTSLEPNQFIALKWNTLANYSGVFINGGGSWSFQNKQIESGDILIKLPGNELLLIKNQAQTFVPYTYNSSASTVWYSATTAGSASETPITISTFPTAAIHGRAWSTEITAPGTFLPSYAAAATIRSTNFYLKSSGESVVWTHSYCTTTVSSIITSALQIGPENPLIVTALQEV